MCSIAQYGYTVLMTGFEDTDTETLIALQSNLLNGISLVGDHLKAGTFEKAKKEGSAPPAQAGALTLILLLSVEDELESRILGFQRSVPV